MLHGGHDALGLATVCEPDAKQVLLTERLDLGFYPRTSTVHNSDKLIFKLSNREHAELTGQYEGITSKTVVRRDDLGRSGPRLDAASGHEAHVAGNVEQHLLVLVVVGKRQGNALRVALIGLPFGAVFRGMQVVAER